MASSSIQFSQTMTIKSIKEKDFHVMKKLEKKALNNIIST